MTPAPDTSTTANELIRVLCLEAGSDEATRGRMSLLCDMLQEQVFVTDAQGVLVYANPASERVTGFSIEALLGRTPAVWRFKEYAADEQTFWSTLQAEKQPYRGTVRNVRKDGTMYEAAVHIAPIPEDNGSVNYFLCVETDMSDSRALDRIQRRVVALTSHNLKTPLASMRWQAEMLRNGDMGRLSKEQKESVDDILGGITRTIAMVEEWLTITYLDQGNYTPHNEPVVLNTVVDDILTELHERIEQEGVTVAVTAPTPCTIDTDTVSIRTVVHALVFNAVKYNHDGGTVDIQVLALPQNSEFEGKTFTEPRTVVSVRDTGPGIPLEDHGKVFHECFHASNSSDMQAAGAGFGLYIAYELVQALRGDIWFRSTPQGSHFVVALPHTAAP